MKLRGVMVVCLFCLISFPSIQTTFQYDNANFDSSISKEWATPMQISFENHSPIRIRSDSEFASIASSEGWMGNGSSNNPYIIENLTIRANITVDLEDYSVEVEHPIHISDTLSSFVIRNCRFLNDTDNEEFLLGIGILLDNVENCIIDSCYLEGLDECIDLDDCTNVEIMNCTTVQGWFGYGAILGAYCQNVTVVNNTISRGSIGFWSSFTCNISANTISGHISISDCDQCIIVDNEIEGSGLGVYSDVAVSNTIFGNTVNGLPIEYYENQIGIILDLSGIGQLILYNSSDVIVRKGYFDTTVQGVTFYYCTNCTLADSEFLDTRFYLRHCVRCTIFNVTTSGGYESEVQFVSDCVIEDCVFTDNLDGFSLAHESYNCIIRNCSFYNNEEYGLLIHHAHNSTITNCTFSNNRDGIYNSIADNNTFTKNTIKDNQLTGLIIHQSSGCVVTENKIYDNRYGMEVAYASDNIIHSNEFGWNIQHVLLTLAPSNSWDNGIDQGNYWSGYAGEGKLILALGALDNYPKPLLLVQGLEQFVYQNSTTGHRIEWSCSALYPVSYAIYFEGNEIESGDWDGNDISVDIDGLTPGSYIFTLYVTEIYGHTESSSVNVIVTDGSTTTTPLEPIVIIFILVLIGAVGVVVIVIIVDKFR